MVTDRRRAVVIAEGRTGLGLCQLGIGLLIGGLTAWLIIGSESDTLSQVAVPAPAPNDSPALETAVAVLLWTPTATATRTATALPAATQTPPPSLTERYGSCDGTQRPGALCVMPALPVLPTAVPTCGPAKAAEWLCVVPEPAGGTRAEAGTE